MAQYVAHRRRMDEANRLCQISVAKTQIFAAVILWWHRLGRSLSLDADYIAFLLAFSFRIRRRAYLHLNRQVLQRYWLQMQHADQRAMELLDGIQYFEQHFSQHQRQLPYPQRLPLAPLLSSVANGPREKMADMVEVG